MLSSSKLPKGSKFSLRVPSIKVGSCGIIVIILLNKDKPTFDISTSSIKIFPLVASIILNKQRHKVLFPLPVLPTIQILSFGLINKFISFKTIFVSGR